MRINEARAARKKMTKAELLASFEKADEVWINQSEELSMQEAYAKDLVTHLREHRCPHDLAAL